jgi:hypothetical protein
VIPSPAATRLADVNPLAHHAEMPKMKTDQTGRRMNRPVFDSIDVFLQKLNIENEFRL